MKNMKLITIVLLFSVLYKTSLCALKIPTTEMGPCQCGVFDKIELNSTDVPLIQQRPMNVTCDESGMKTCTKMCTALAEAAKIRGPSLLCSSIQHVNNLKASVFVRTCNDEKWTYTGLSNPELICCHAGQPITCDKPKI